MPTDSASDEREELEQITKVWEEFDNTGDESLLSNVLHDEVVFLPPGNSPIVGKSAVVEMLQEFPSNAYSVEHSIEDILVGEQLAVV